MYRSEGFIGNMPYCDVTDLRIESIPTVDTFVYHDSHCNIHFLGQALLCDPYCLGRLSLPPFVGR